MSQKSETLKTLIVSLLTISLISGVLLSATQLITSPVIVQGKAQRLQDTLATVLENFTNNPGTEQFTLEAYPNLTFYPARNQDGLSGIAVRSVTSKGYAGDIVILAGFRTDGSVIKATVLELKETPGLGTKLKEEKFLVQFPNLQASGFPLKVKKDGGGIDALTAATISSRAFLDALNQAQNALTEAFDSANTKALEGMP